MGLTQNRKGKVRDRNSAREISMTIWRMLAIVALPAILSGCERWTLDSQMDEWCKKDGGVKVYERVELSPSDFSSIRDRLSKGSSPSSGGYRFASEVQILVGKSANAQAGQGQVRRIREAIYREEDGKLLGEEIAYDRSGGDWVTFGFQPSSSYCPLPRVGIFNAIFSEKR